MGDSKTNSRVAIVTGGGTGIGAATAHKLAVEGYRVIVTGRRREPIEEVARAINGRALAADASSADAARAIVATAVGEFGGLDLLVLNHGISHHASLLETTDENWDEVLSVNLSGAFHLSRAALPALIERRGALVAVGSCAARQVWPERGAYSVSKVGLAMLMRVIACEYGANVRANTVNPGTVATPMVEWQVEGLASRESLSIEEAWSTFTSAAPQGRPATPSEVAAAIAWLGSPAASYVNGATLDVDGGVSIVGASAPR